MYHVDSIENASFKTFGYICWSTLPCSLLDKLSIDKRDSDGFLSKLECKTSNSSCNYLYWLITGHSRLITKLLGFNFVCSKPADQAYRRAGNFHGVQFSQMVNLYYFTDLIFTDVRTHAHYVLYSRAYFAGLIFAVRQSAMKIGPLKKFSGIRYMHTCAWSGSCYIFRNSVIYAYLLLLYKLSMYWCKQGLQLHKNQHKSTPFCTIAKCPSLARTVLEFRPMSQLAQYSTYVLEFYQSWA